MLHTVPARVSPLHSVPQGGPCFFLPAISFTSNFMTESSNFPQGNMQEAETLKWGSVFQNPHFICLFVLVQQQLAFPLPVTSDFSVANTEHAPGSPCQRASASFCCSAWSPETCCVLEVRQRVRRTMEPKAHKQWKPPGLDFPTRHYRGWASPGRYHAF